MEEQEKFGRKLALMLQKIWRQDRGKRKLLQKPGPLALDQTVGSFGSTSERTFLNADQ